MTRARVLLLAAVLGVTLVFFVDLCDLVFDCGCRSLWNGAAAHCNIHHALPPHCPWCLHPLTGGATAFFAAAAAQAGIVLVPTGRFGLLARGLVALVAFPIASGVAGWVVGLLFGYWG